MVAAQVAELRLEERFCGLPATANGGYACGAIAELLGGAEVTLRRPPPLGRPLRLRVGDGGALVHDGAELVAEAQPATVGLAVPARPPRPRPGRRPHAPRCSRAIPPDLLHLRTRPRRRRRAADLPRAAARRRPVGSAVDARPLGRRPRRAGRVRGDLGGNGLSQRFAAGVGDTVMVLGRMAARVLARPRADTAYCLVAWRTGPAAGRKQPARSALLDAHGRVLAVARTIWVTIPKAGADAVTAQVIPQPLDRDRLAAARAKLTRPRRRP